MGGIIIVDLYLQRINQEAQRRGHWAATTGALARVGNVRGAREIRLNSRKGFTKPEVHQKEASPPPWDVWEISCRQTCGWQPRASISLQKSVNLRMQRSDCPSSGLSDTLWRSLLHSCSDNISCTDLIQRILELWLQKKKIPFSCLM